ncbi:hypothetical protein B0H10DRAFT_2319769 [Mycena sp. CBHHK59/15]|nr:hypothetical protein B0H10DRAFT_2319769 [Mycena sp. CBHHK59/15]
MVKRKTRETHYDLGPDPEESEHIRAAQLSHSSKTFHAPASPTRGEASRPLRPDEVTPVYDHLDALEPHVPSKNSDSNEDEVARALRESDPPLRQWVEDHRQQFLDEMLRWEGRGDHRSYSICPECVGGRAEYRCKDCLGGGQLICHTCLLK